MLNKLDDFTRAYLECSLWASNDDEGNPLDEDYSLNDLSEEALQCAVDDCTSFQQENKELLDLAYYV
jgi:hypothetical protein